MITFESIINSSRNHQESNNKAAISKSNECTADGAVVYFRIALWNRDIHLQCQIKQRTLNHALFVWGLGIGSVCTHRNVIFKFSLIMLAVLAIIDISKDWQSIFSYS